jgi:hypothetical protein
MFTAYPTTSSTYSPTQNATLPIIVVDGQATNMTTTNALIGSTLALIIVAVALAAARYLPTGWAQRIRRMIPQSTIDNFKRDPLGSVTAMVNDPKSILKNIQIPDSVKSVKDLVASVTVPQVADDGDKIVETRQRSRRAASPTVKSVVEIPPVPVKDPSPPPTPPPEPEMKEVVNVDTGIIVAKDETKIATPTLIEIKPEDLEALKAFMESRNVHHVILQ